MTKREQKAIEKFIEKTENAIKNRGFYMPSDAQIEALKTLAKESASKISKRDSIRIDNLIFEISSANENEVYTVCATPNQLAAIKRAVIQALQQ